MAVYAWDFSGNTKCSPRTEYEGSQNSVLELVFDHLGEDQEWAWVKDFQNKQIDSYTCPTPHRLTRTIRCITLRSRPVLKAWKSGLKLLVVQPAYYTACNLASTRLSGIQPGVMSFLILSTRISPQLRDPEIKGKLLAEKSVIKGGLMQDL